MVHVFDSITVGRGDNNKVIINDVKVAANQLQLIRNNNRLLVRNLSEDLQVELRRGNYSTYVGGKPIYVESQDLIIMGQTTLRFTFV